jgi:hypothetical protein
MLRVMSKTLKSWAVSLGAVAVLSSFAVISAPVSGAVCAAASGRHVSVGGCTNVPADIAVGVVASDDNEAAQQAANGEQPCFSPSGQPYYTPVGQPC